MSWSPLINIPSGTSRFKSRQRFSSPSDRGLSAGTTPLIASSLTAWFISCTFLRRSDVHPLDVTERIWVVITTFANDGAAYPAVTGPYYPQQMLRRTSDSHPWASHFPPCCVLTIIHRRVRGRTHGSVLPAGPQARHQGG